MKDIIIKSDTVKRELLVFGACFVLACLMNIYAISIAGTPWSELFTQLGYVMFIALVVYLLLALVRLIVCFLIKPFRRKRRR